MQKEFFILTPKSNNRKTGKIPVSMSHMGTCPSSCKLRSGCYAMTGRLGLVWRKLGMGLLTNGGDWESFCEKCARCDPRSGVTTKLEIFQARTTD
jgi:hypothetical protein